MSSWYLLGLAFSAAAVWGLPGGSGSREIPQQRRGAAGEFLRERPNDRLCVTFVTGGEMAVGPAPDGKKHGLPVISY